MSHWLCEQVEKNCAELRQTMAITEQLVEALWSTIGQRGRPQPKRTEVSMSSSIRDALSATSNGQQLVVQVKEYHKSEQSRKEEIAGRIRSLKQLVHDTFVTYPREHGRRIRFDVYQNSKERVRELGVEGGDEYKKAVMALQYAQRSKKEYFEAMDLLSTEHDFASYESSDGVTRR